MLLLASSFRQFYCVVNVAAFAPNSPLVQPNKRNVLFHLNSGSLKNKRIHLETRCTPTFAFSSTSTALSLASDKNRMEVGIQTAQLLMDAQRRDELRKQLKQKFPLVPESLLDAGIDITAQAFTEVAPGKLKAALRPGGMDQMRPEIEQVIVDYALEQPIVKNSPILDKKDRRNVLVAIVDMALDYVLKDAQEVLAAPEVRLEELEEKVKAIKRQMGTRRLIWYRIRHNSKGIALAFVVSAAAMLLYQQRSAPIVAKVLKTTTKMSAPVSAAITKFWTASRSSLKADFKLGRQLRR